MSQMLSGGEGPICLPTITALHVTCGMQCAQYIELQVSRSRPKMQPCQRKAAGGRAGICQSLCDILRRRHPSPSSCIGHWLGVFMALTIHGFSAAEPGTSLIILHPIEQTAYRLWPSWLQAVQWLSRAPAFLRLCCDATIVRSVSVARRINDGRHV